MCKITKALENFRNTFFHSWAHKLQVQFSGILFYPTTYSPIIFALTAVTNVPKYRTYSSMLCLYVINKSICNTAPYPTIKAEVDELNIHTHSRTYLMRHEHLPTADDCYVNFYGTPESPWIHKTVQSMEWSAEVENP